MKPEKGKASNGNILNGFKAKPIKHLLSEVSCDQSPATQYESIKHTKSLSTLFSICKAKSANGRMLEVNYDSRQRVKTLRISGCDKPLYSFDYHSDYTTVVDANGGKKKFEFSKRRLIKVTEMHRTQNYVWDKKGQLIAHTILTPAEKQVCRRNYKYDERGNILEIQVKGNITKNEADDCDITRYTYSQEHNLPLTENHNHMIEYTNTYVPKTNLLARRLTYVANQGFTEREFYDYDKNGILIRKIVDDGGHPDLDDLRDVSFRLITEIEPQLDPSQNGMTLPHIIWEWSMDIKTGEKHLLKKTERLYAHGDLLAEEKIFDANNTYRYSLLYEYNHRRELVRETNALGESTIYTYDDNGNKIYEEKLGSGKKTHFRYDLGNRLIEEKEEHPGKTLTRTYIYDSLGNRIREIDSYGQPNFYQFDLSSREIVAQDPLANAERKEYDAFGNVIKLTDKDGYVVNNLCNLFGKPLEIAHPDGTVEKFAYDLQGHLVEEWKRDGTHLVYKVDYKGRIKEAQTYSANEALLKTLAYVYKGPNLVAEIDALGNQTQYRYDCAGRKIAKIQGGVTTQYAYDALGRLSKTITGNRVDITEYDFLDRIIEKRAEDLSGKVFNKTQYTYDILGNQTIQREYNDEFHYSETRTLFNSQSLPVLRIDPLGFEEKIIYKQTDHLEKETIDPLGRRTIEVYDALQRLFEEKTFSPAGVLLAHHWFIYDGRGNRLARTDEILSNGSCIGVHQIDTVFDGMNQKIQETEQNSKVTKWTYQKGRLETLTNPDGVVLTHTYDALGRLEEQTSSDGSIHYKFCYDLNDNLLAAEDQIHGISISRAYDSLQRVIYEKQASGLNFSFSYDEQNRITEMRFCDGAVLYTYSPTALLTASRYKNGQLAYSYAQECNWRNKVIKAIFPQQITCAYEWDEMGRCQRIHASTYQQELTYDPVGNLIKTSVNDAVGQYDAAFEYDGLYQLTQENSPFANQYAYDSLQNRRSKNDIALPIDALNQLTHDGAENYSYDANGRRTGKGDARYSYDALGRLLSFRQGTIDITYRYDPLGRRIKRITPDSTVDFLYQFDAEIGCWTDRLTEFRLIYNKYAAVSVELNDTPYIPIRNHRGDIVQLLNASGEAFANYRFDAFGNFFCEGTNICPWLFSGQRYEPATQFFHFDKRDYDPFTGTWLTPDPLGFADGPNLFAYVHNNPLIYIDPYGLFREEAKDFMHGASRGAIDDTTWNASSKVLGAYHATSNFGKAGYYAGTAASMIASVSYGGAEIRLAKGAYTLVKKTLQGIASKSTKLFRAGKLAGNKTPTQKIFEQAINVEKTAGKELVAREGAETVNRAISFAGTKRFPLEYAPYQKIRNKPAIINGRNYSGHALDRMQDRGEVVWKNWTGD